MNHTGTIPITAARLLLRRFRRSDAEDMFRAWTGDEEVMRHVTMKRHGNVGEARLTLGAWLDAYSDPSYYNYAIETRDGGALIGSVAASVRSEKNETAEIGYCIGRRWQNNGYATEAVRALLDYLFLDAGFNRIEAGCAAGNTPSVSVLTSAGMDFEGISREKYKIAGQFTDSLNYALTRSAYDRLHLPAGSGFLEFPPELLADGCVSLSVRRLEPQNEAKGYVPAYAFDINLDGTPAGVLSLRLGFSPSLYYGGHIGYEVNAAHRNRGIATRALRLALNAVRLHGFRRIIITNNVENPASKRVCEKAGGRFVRTARIPEWHELYKEGQRELNIFCWDLP